METCAQAHLSNNDANKLTICFEEGITGDLTTDITNCGKTLNLDLTKVLDCYQSSEGNTLEHQVAIDTGALNPRHTYVPWLTGNGSHDAE